MTTETKHPFGSLIGLRVDEREGGTGRTSITLGPDHENPNGVAHGAVLYALVDTAMGAALYSLLDEGQRAATVEVKINYFRAVARGDVVAVARVVHRSRRLCTLEAEVSQEGELVAKALGTFALLGEG